MSFLKKAGSCREPRRCLLGGGSSRLATLVPATESRRELRCVPDQRVSQESTHLVIVVNIKTDPTRELVKVGL